LTPPGMSSTARSKSCSDVVMGSLVFAVVIDARITNYSTVNEATKDMLNPLIE